VALQMMDDGTADGRGFYLLFLVLAFGSRIKAGFKEAFCAFLALLNWNTGGYREAQRQRAMHVI
jgi:hypothetical protein